MSEFNAVKDSGQRREFGTGSVRDVRDGKGRYDLLPPGAIFRLARHFENGAKKYGDNNWLKGQPLSGYLDSGLRHGFKILAGMKDEDHAAAAAWNFMAFIETAMRIEDGRLPKELDDIGYTSKEDSQIDKDLAESLYKELQEKCATIPARGLCAPNPDWKDCCLECRCMSADDGPGQICEGCRQKLSAKVPANAEPAQCGENKCACMRPVRGT